MTTFLTGILVLFILALVIVYCVIDIANNYEEDLGETVVSIGVLIACYVIAYNILLTLTEIYYSGVL